MKVRVEIDGDLKNKEIVIKAPRYDAETESLYQSIQNLYGQIKPLVFLKGTSEYYLDVNDILFFETDGRQVHAHT